MQNEDAENKLRSRGEGTEPNFRYYTTKNFGFIELRQIRFRAQFLRGYNHPYDVCAVARNNEEMKTIIESVKLTGKVDYSRTESMKEGVVVRLNERITI